VGPETQDTLTPVDVRRARIIAETTDTYARYAASGYSARWSRALGTNDPTEQERDSALVDAIRDVAGRTVLDIGCGGGNLGLALERKAGRSFRYVGIDLLDNRIADARERVPWGEFHVASADRLPLGDDSVDVVVAATLFSSIPDVWFRREIAGEVDRVLRTSGHVVIYDLRYPSPRNPSVRPIRRKELNEMFPGWQISIKSLTLVPPIARSRLGSGRLRYRILSRLPFLRSHLLAVISRG
jgi:SAM-dependent methyltransferase